MLRRLRWKTLIVIAVIVGVSFASLAVRNVDLNLGFDFERGSDDVLGLTLGLDLAGGTQLIYKAGGENFEPSVAQMEGLIDIISRRVDGLGVAEPSIQQLGDDRLLIQLPGIEDVEDAKSLIGRTAQLEIVERVCLDRNCVAFEDRPTGLTGAEMARANPGQDPTTGQPALLFELNSSGARRFAEVTQRILATNVEPDTITGQVTPDQLAFVLDNEVLVSAGVSSAILTGNGQISGSLTSEDVRRLALQIESGRLPVPINELSSTVIAASLGAESLDDALIAGLVGLALVLFFMIAYYRMAGVVAAISLVFYTAIVLAVFKLIPVTVTLAGLAAFILSLGMAVDANILIFERVKEELRIGRALQFATEIGFSRAWQSIRDGNVSTLIIAAILFLFGQSSANSSVSGFAITLSIGVLTSMFTAIVISRTILRVVTATALRRYPRLFTPDMPARNAAETGA